MNPLLEVDWWLRQRLRASPPAPAPRRRDGEAWLASLRGRPAARLQELRDRYDLSKWPDACPASSLLESLWTLDVLDRHVGPHAAGPGSGGPRPGDGRMEGPGLDIGSKSWAYLPALVAFAPGDWTGVELDAHRRFASLRTRRAVAERCALNFPGCGYVAGSVESVRGRFGFVTWLLPFVRPAALRAWGLPGRYFRPLELLRHAWERVAEGGVLWVVNQEAGESDLQRRLFAKAGIEARELGPLESAFSPYRRQRFGWIARRPLPPPPSTSGTVSPTRSS